MQNTNEHRSASRSKNRPRDEFPTIMTVVKAKVQKQKPDLQIVTLMTAGPLQAPINFTEACLAILVRRLTQMCRKQETEISMREVRNMTKRTQTWQDALRCASQQLNVLDDAVRKG